MSDLYDENLDTQLNRSGGMQQGLDQLIWPNGAGTGQSRIVAGADTPPELATSGRPVAILFYDVIAGVEVGYHYIASEIDTDHIPGGEPTLEYGYVIYPIPGDPTSPTVADVKYYIRQESQSAYQFFKQDTLVDGAADIVQGSTLSDTKYLSGENGRTTITLAAASSKSTAQLYVGNYTVPPSASVNINDGSGTFSNWHARAIGQGNAGFTIFVFGPAPATGSFQVNWRAERMF